MTGVNKNTVQAYIKVNPKQNLSHSIIIPQLRPDNIMCWHTFGEGKNMTK